MVTAQQALAHSHTIDLPCNTWIPEGQIVLTDVDAAHLATRHGLTDRTGITFVTRWEYRGQSYENRNADPPYPTPMTWDNTDRSDTIFALHGMLFSHRRGVWGRPLKHATYPFRVRVIAYKDAAKIGSEAAIDLTLNITGHSAILVEEEYLHHGHGHGGHNHHHMHHGTEESAALKTVHDELRAIRVRLGALENPAVHSSASSDSDDSDTSDDEA